ncbi:MAG: diaminopimelate decarboxylase [Cyanobacteria bacterium P01_H01_bin.130]
MATPTLDKDVSRQTSSLQYIPDASARTADASPNQFLMPLNASVSDRDTLVVGGCDVTELVEKFGSPLYILDEQNLRKTCQQYRDSFKDCYGGESQVIYASKAWSCTAICAIAHSEGIGMDVVSGGELHTALNAGVPASKIYLHGNNKSVEELALAVDHGCTVIADNWFDLHNLVALKPAAPIRVMLRLTPGIECHTHEYIRTGHIDSKFGFDPTQVEEVFDYVTQQDCISVIGLHAHIGSQIFETQPHNDLGDVMVSWFKKALDRGLPVTELNIGGGLGIRYTEQDDPPSIRQWIEIVSQGVSAACEKYGVAPPKLIAEPGRSLVGSSCITAYRVGSQKTVPGIRHYVSVDGGMSDNPRPITYQSLYRSVVANRMSAPFTETVTVAGKHCESGDVVIPDATLPALETDDVLVVLATGAYNASMASNYNRVPRPAAVLVNNGEANVILKRETNADLLRGDCLPTRLQQR